MASVSNPLSRGRILQQVLPTAPTQYDQVYLNQLVSAINAYMSQTQQPGDVVAGRFIWSDPVTVGPAPSDDYTDVSRFPTGMLYLMQAPGAPAGTYFLTVVMPSAPAVNQPLPPADEVISP